jgi:hypothetical protein
MKLRPLLLILAFVQCGSGLRAREKEHKPPAPTQWCYAGKGSLEVRAKAGESKKPLLTLGQGALVAGFESKKSGDRTWVRVAAVDPEKMVPVAGWTDSTRLDVFPASQFPADKEILKLIGGVFLEDFAAANTTVGRYLLRLTGKEPALLCYVGGVVLPQTHLQVFSRAQGKLSPGPYLELPFSEMQSPIIRLEIRDLLGDGNDCLITREPYGVGPQNSGMNMVIRRVEAGAFKILGKIPLGSRHLAAYPPKMQILQPPELNIGRPGTDTKGDVEFRARGTLTDIVWKGKVNFHALGREEPVESLPVDKTWSWDGTKFAPL